jgi:hypothetical protein
MKISVGETEGGERIRVRFDDMVVELDGSAAAWLGRTLEERARRRVANGSDDPRRQALNEIDDGVIDRTYPHKWPGAQVQKPLEGVPRCGVCGDGQGGLRMVGTEWRCAEHREAIDHSSHRNDLRDALDRDRVAAVADERKRIIGMLESGSVDDVLRSLRG